MSWDFQNTPEFRHSKQSFWEFTVHVYSNADAEQHSFVTVFLLSIKGRHVTHGQGPAIPCLLGQGEMKPQISLTLTPRARLSWYVWCKGWGGGELHVTQDPLVLTLCHWHEGIMQPLRDFWLRICPVLEMTGTLQRSFGSRALLCVFLPYACPSLYCWEKAPNSRQVNYNWDHFIPMEAFQKPCLRDKDLEYTQSLPSRSSQNNKLALVLCF